MNSKEYQKAMACFEPDPFLRARIAAAVKERKRPRTRYLRKALTAACAAALALVCTTAVALAVRPELRAAVISLFRLDAVEQVPGIPAGVNEVRQVTIGETVTARYVKVEGYWHWPLDGELLRSGDWSGSGNIFYELDGETLTEIGADAPAASARAVRNGVEYTAMFRWFVYNGVLYTDEIATGTLFGGMDDLTLAPSRLGERTDVVQLTAAVYGQFMESYTWVYDLESGEVTDVLEGCGVEALGPVRTVGLAEDLKHAIVQAGDTMEGTPYLADLEQKTLTPLNEIFGIEIREWRPQTGPEGGYRARFCDNNTVLLTTGNRAWTYHIPSGALSCTVENLTGMEIIDSPRGMLCLSVDEAGGVSIVDLATGGRVKLEGVSAKKAFICKANSTDTKLLWAEWDWSGEFNRVLFDRLGVIDLKSGEFTAFDREHLEGLQSEWAYWLGDDRIMIITDVHWAEGYDPDRTAESYLCVYEF